MRRRLALLLLCAWLPAQRARADDYGAVATAARLARPLANEPASVTVLRREEIALNPTLGTDALLRSLPSALTFRRSTSRVADPSSQGLNLRGVGPSGVSRTLLLVDGIPANDPFSGSIYWRALPRLGVERIEVVPSGSSALYGSAALAGVVQLISRPLTPSYEGEVSYGSFRTALLAARAAERRGPLAYGLEGEWLRSDGFPVVAPAQRGVIDGNADSQHGTLNAQVEGEPNARTRLSASARLFRERQNGGTRYTNAGVDLALFGLGGTFALTRGELDLRLFGRLQRFAQERARIAPERMSELRAARQEVPADDQGASLVYRTRERSAAGRHRLAVGVDLRRVQGVSRERLYSAMPSAEAAGRREAGGEQLAAGVFAQELYSPTSTLQLDLALRADVWNNRAGSQLVVREGGVRERTSFDARTELAVSPRVGLLWRPHDALALRASGYRAFRAPTLNELYRPFQVGTVLTAANPELGPELLSGFEAGVELAGTEQLVLRATGFWNHLDRPISNVTLPLPLADGAERQRQNLGSAVVRGLEASLELRVWRRFSTILAYTLAASEVREAGTIAALRGKQLPQAPRHRASALLSYDEPGWFSATVQVRALSEQFENDLNTLPMKAYAVIDASLSWRLGWKIDLLLAVENLLDTEYLVGRAGVDTIGQPLLARVGLRVREGTTR